MTATELRIGNLVKGGQTAPVPNEWTKDEWRTRYEELQWQDNIIEITEQDFQENKGFWAAMRLEHLQGIPLTEYWLKKFGFDDYGYKYFDGFNAKLNIKLSGDKWSVRLKRNNSLAFINQIQYVHQLQNLYFALTGEELTIKT